MNYSTAIFLISDKARAVMVTYEEYDGAPETMYKTFSTDIKVDDYVVVPTDSRHHMTVCKVAKVDVEPDFETDKNVAWIIGTVDPADYEDLKRQEAEAIAKIRSAEKRRKRAELADALVADMSEEDLKSLPFYTDKKE